MSSEMITRSEAEEAGYQKSACGKWFTNENFETKFISNVLSVKDSETVNQLEELKDMIDQAVVLSKIDRATSIQMRGEINKIIRQIRTVQ